MSEDRKQEGLILLHSVRANTSITIRRRLRSFGQWIRRSKEDAAILPSIRLLDVKAQSLGQSILLISSDTPEVIRLSDRILVMRNHAIVGELPNDHRYDELSEAIMARLS